MGIKREDLQGFGPEVKRLNPGLLEEPLTVAPEPAVSAAYEREVELHREILAECTRRGWVALYSDPTRRTGRPLGEQDITIFAEYPLAIVVECKIGRNKLSADQMGMRARFYKLGWTYHVVRSMEEFNGVVWMEQEFAGKKRRPTEGGKDQPQMNADERRSEGLNHG